MLFLEINTEICPNTGRFYMDIYMIANKFDKIFGKYGLNVVSRTSKCKFLF